MLSSGDAWPPVYDEHYRPDDGQPYWWPERETMAPAEREQLVLKKLQAQVRWAYERSSFYRRKWEAAGVWPDTLRTLDDLSRFPVVTKQELR